MARFMGEGKETTLATARRIHRKLVQQLAVQRVELERAKRRLGERFNEATSCAAATVRMLEEWLAGSAPVGVTRGVWKQVCEESR